MGVYAASRLTARLRAGNGTAPGLIFREQRSGDTGLNAHLEVVEEYPKMGKLVGLQVRAGSSWQDLSAPGNGVERTARGYVCRGEMAHVAYWLQHSLPVLVMVYEREKDQLVWEKISPDTIEISEQHWELLVPYDQVYGEETAQSIADLPCYSPYLARLAMDRPWMQLLDVGREILLEMDEWLNQPSERGSLRLSVLDERGERESVYEWPFQTNPDMPHVFRLASLFPWAHIGVDEMFYREKIGEDAANAGSLFPWIVEAGEIARFRLRLSLNELGHSFLTAERFLRRGEFPVETLSSGFGAEYENGLKFQLYGKRS
ncbi:MAG: DUF4365 domain-containing protein [Synergistaceae bacterium]|nr:DUF4365 domain-containing protein [Synergistaceae bacterium]